MDINEIDDPKVQLVAAALDLVYEGIDGKKWAKFMELVDNNRHIYDDWIIENHPDPDVRAAARAAADA